jgi:branched-chain amino acid transport system ATP-binding protein
MSQPGAELVVSGVSSGYRGAKILRSVDLRVPPGSVAAVLGANGAGKTTLLRTIVGLLPAMSGTITLDGHDVTREPPYRRIRRGLCLVPEGRGTFPALTVRENLQLQSRSRREESAATERALSAFPALGKRMSQTAGTMSGGEQQMLALAQAWGTRASVILVDEVSMGLAPLIVDEMFRSLQRLADLGATLLIVEQYVSRALKVADTIYLLEKGEVIFSGAPGDLSGSEIASRYLGAV